MKALEYHLPGNIGDFGRFGHSVIFSKLPPSLDFSIHVYQIRKWCWTSSYKLLTHWLYSVTESYFSFVASLQQLKGMCQLIIQNTDFPGRF